MNKSCTMLYIEGIAFKVNSIWDVIVSISKYEECVDYVLISGIIAQRITRIIGFKPEQVLVNRFNESGLMIESRELDVSDGENSRLEERRKDEMYVEGDWANGMLFK
jgi:hypothetical protein